MGHHAVDQDGDVIDLLVQPRRDRRAAERFFRKAIERTGPHAETSDHETASQLFGGPQHCDAICSAQHAAARKQSSRGLSSTDTLTRTADAAIQICRACTTIPVAAWARSKSLSRGAPPLAGGSSPGVENPLLPNVERRHGHLLNTTRNRHRRMVDAPFSTTWQCRSDGCAESDAANATLALKEANL